MGLSDLPKRIRDFLTRSSGPSMVVRVTSVEMEGDGDRVRISFRLPTGQESTAVLDIGPRGGEVREFMQEADQQFLADIVGDTVEVNLAKFPEFYQQCEEPPTELMLSVANHPEAIERTSFSDSDVSSKSLEELLFERFRSLGGISDAEAREMAKDEALSMGEVSALELEEGWEEPEKEGEWE